MKNFIYVFLLLFFTNAQSINSRVFPINKINYHDPLPDDEYIKKESNDNYRKVVDSLAYENEKLIKLINDDIIFLEKQEGYIFNLDKKIKNQLNNYEKTNHFNDAYIDSVGMLIFRTEVPEQSE